MFMAGSTSRRSAELCPPPGSLSPAATSVAGLPLPSTTASPLLSEFSTRATPIRTHPLAAAEAHHASEEGERGAVSDAEDRAAAADARGLHPLLHHPRREGPQPPPDQRDNLRARFRQAPPRAQAGDGGRAQVGGAHAPAPLHRAPQRHRAAAGRRPGRGRRALRGRDQARHRGPRLARVPH